MPDTALCIPKCSQGVACPPPEILGIGIFETMAMSVDVQEEHRAIHKHYDDEGQEEGDDDGVDDP